MGNNTFLTIATMVLFSILIFNTMKHILYSTDRTIEANNIYTAVSLGQEMIKEISSKSFDESCVSGNPEDSTEFTLTLKAENGEAISDYDDVDDYNGFSKHINTDYAGSYDVSTEVNYVLSNNPKQKSFSRTRVKRITVWVHSTTLIDTIKLNYYSSY